MAAMLAAGMRLAAEATPPPAAFAVRDAQIRKATSSQVTTGRGGRVNIGSPSRIDATDGERQQTDVSREGGRPLFWRVTSRGRGQERGSPLPLIMRVESYWGTQPLARLGSWRVGRRLGFVTSRPAARQRRRHVARLPPSQMTHIRLPRRRRRLCFRLTPSQRPPLHLAVYSCGELFANCVSGRSTKAAVRAVRPGNDQCAVMAADACSGGVRLSRSGATIGPSYKFRHSAEAVEAV